MFMKTEHVGWVIMELQFYRVPNPGLIRCRDQDTYAGRTAKLAIQKNVICEKCEGKGGKEGAVKRCNTCDGRGAVVRQCATWSSVSCTRAVLYVDMFI